jgi:hypothetical protein
MRSIFLSANLLGTASLISAMRLHNMPDMSGGLDLATLADMDTEEVKGITTILFPEGIAAVKITEARLGQTQVAEGEVDEKGNPKIPQPFVQFGFEVADFQPTDKGLDGEDFIGRKLSERHTLWTSELKERIALLKGTFEKCGLSTSGKLGGLEGGEPGWLDEAVDQLIMIRIKHSRPRNPGDEPRARYKWEKLETNQG